MKTLYFDSEKNAIAGSAGILPLHRHDDMIVKFLMLVEGECTELGPLHAAQKYGYSKQRYYQLRQAFQQKGAPALVNKPRWPKSPYRRTSEVLKQVVRYRFLDADASAAVIAQKLRQSGWTISTRSVERVLRDFGLQKKTAYVSTG